MSATLLLAGAVLLGDAGELGARQAEARALVEKAVQAQWGMDKLLLTNVSLARVHGNFGGKNTAFEGDVYSQTGGKLRVNLLFKEGHNPGVRLLVLDGPKGWLQFNGVTEDLDQDTMARMKKSSHVDRVSGLTALMRDKEYQLSPLGASLVK